MVLPLLPLIAIAGAGAIAGVGTSSLLGGGGSNPNATGSVTYEAPYRNYSPTYSPTTSTQTTSVDARQFSDARVLNYSPSLIIESPNAVISKKEELTSSVQAQQSAQAIPTLYAVPTTTGSATTENKPVTSGLDTKTILILGLIAGGAIIASSYFGKGK